VVWNADFEQTIRVGAALRPNLGQGKVFIQRGTKINTHIIFLSGATDNRIIGVDMRLTAGMLEIKEARRNRRNGVILVGDMCQRVPELQGTLLVSEQPERHFTVRQETHLCIHKVSPILIPTAWQAKHRRGHFNRRVQSLSKANGIHHSNGSSQRMPNDCELIGIL
jgi:hypothetical protein